ncbi:PPC domain-containing protein [Ponticoccus sp. SC2-23]|uniref:PPC domain-containing protein n=1 Tax=Alexandriicola marinus TaxID=2081710 RepID=UPI000FDC87F1|nr:PPC domain-containing protein [Alexandriicola marinus]MBM1220461.1 PPC domain-containing protein [Ponticoccus sp. SC6-9]MBM1225147.1 PPC domain-containing protein [Ponticoccus sp. SC6-15]MBM1228661.1 PPC domain-containing protein [Ponticoccus sp. SC6-38]MBM1233702.1 PPC domain-containing protein [Ponticoccus sp. SC6-45]MBM1239162.1 PPC domain-containing protein [Ponticoccus sp. SC6-49]MBM1242944.1 PPC domain-containing protein [Ponticoccus sp. SC2-64]MBM1247226.1 PPC domain-containing pro
MSKSSIGLWLAATALAGVAAPAAAQSGLCGGVGDNGQWIGGSEQSSDISTAGSYMEQMALVLLGNEYVALFTVSSPTEVRVEAAGRGGGDPVIDLRDAGGTIVLSDDDSGGEGNSRGEMMLSPGTYCLSMTSYDGSPMTGFVRVSRTEQDALTIGTGQPTPPPPPPGPDNDDTDPMPTPVGGGICGPGSRDLAGGPIDGMLVGNGTSGTASVDEVTSWGFTLAAPAAVSITAENPNADPLITLYDVNGNYLAENDDFDGLNSRIDMTSPLSAGTYCIDMEALSDSSLPITVSVAGYDPNAALFGQYERGEASPPLDGSYPITTLGPLGNRVRQDINITDVMTWISFDIDQSGLVVVEAVSNGIGDPIMVLYDDFGRLVAENDDYGGDLDPLVAARVTTGTYLVGVRQFNDGETGPVRILFERYVPAQ